MNRRFRGNIKRYRTGLVAAAATGYGDRPMASKPSSLRSIHRVLCEDRALAALCSQNGWIDNDTLWFEVENERGNGARVSVYFEEVITKGGGCVARRLGCWGRVRITFRGGEGRVQVL